MTARTSRLAPASVKKKRSGSPECSDDRPGRGKVWLIRKLGELEIAGSNPAALIPAITAESASSRDVGKPGNPPALGAGDRRFESGRPDYSKIM